MRLTAVFTRTTACPVAISANKRAQREDFPEKYDANVVTLQTNYRSTQDIVEFNDDLGTQENLMMSPELYRKFIKPRHKLLVKMFKKYAPAAKVFFHSCGSVYKIIPDFIDIGIDILNPVQPYRQYS